MKLCSLFYKYTYKNISRNLIMTNMENYNSIIDIDKKIIENLKNNNKDIIDIVEYKEDYSTNDLVIKRIQDINNYRQELKRLVNMPIIKQRTPEWLEARKTRLTASDLYDAIKNNKISDNIAKKKANILKDNINYNAIKALKWGTMFELMATRVYANTNNKVHIYDFGLICDPNNEHFGASPDGINELGIMIEIKCPYSREIINDYVPEKYKSKTFKSFEILDLSESQFEYICLNLNENEQ